MHTTIHINSDRWQRALLLGCALGFFVAGDGLHADTTAPAAARSSTSTAHASLAVCVYCGASELTDHKYIDAAERLGEGLAERKWSLVWGGSKTGVMGAVARGAKARNGRVIGVIPQFIKAWEVEFTGADEMSVVTTMSERKARLQAKADAFVVLPGGIGSLDELFDTLELKQLKFHEKPIIIFNQDGYYDKLLAFIDTSIRENFVRDAVRTKFVVATTIDEVLRQLEKATVAEAAK